MVLNRKFSLSIPKSKSRASQKQKNEEIRTIYNQKFFRTYFFEIFEINNFITSFYHVRTNKKECIPDCLEGRRRELMSNNSLSI